MKALFRQYLRDLIQVASHGDAREESFYPTLANTLERFAEKIGKSQVHITTLPKSTDAGNPDFRIWNGNNRVIGYIEAKKPTETRLDQVEESEQLQRYLETFPNLILTNFFEFRFYRNGETVDSAEITQPFDLTKPPQTVQPRELERFQALLTRFFDFSLPRAFTAETLAIELAKRTRFLRDMVQKQLADERDEPGNLTGFFDAFKEYLISDLTVKTFADLFAQTITYGLFAARTRAEGDFSRRVAFNCIPNTIGILRHIFRFVSMGELPSQLEWVIDDISELLAVADVPGILDSYYKEGKGSDPVIHFYETFLAKYNPGERMQRGVYYTPEPVVSYIVRSVHELLKSKFGKPDGLASKDVTLLDPAAGTMTFVARAAQEATKEFESKYGTGAREDFLQSHIIQNFYAFELMVAPYAIGHLKMGFFLDELGYRLADEERVHLYLTNTLDMKELKQSAIVFLSSLADESRLAGQIKKEKPILIILGNPPYSSNSVNRGEWILKKIDDYKQVDGILLNEKNPKALQDDYVKFLRFAQWKIEEAGRGVVGMITNHSYLDNPTFRGMRHSLMKTFDEIYVLDLHGNSKKREKCPDGSKDENVFDITQGVAIAFFIKHGNEGAHEAVRHFDVWGLRSHKYVWLEQHDITNTDWQDLQPESRFYLFKPIDASYAAAYDDFVSVNDIFPLNTVGIVTARDNLTIHWSREEIWNTVALFSRQEPELARQTYKLGKDSQEWRVDLAQEDLIESGPARDKIIPILYRSFDRRYTYYTGKSRGFMSRPRPKVMNHMLRGENVGLITMRQVSLDEPYTHVLVADCIIDNRALMSSRGYSYLAPLYTYPDLRNAFQDPDFQGRELNLAPEIVKGLRNAYDRQPTPEEIFYYVYAILYSPSYREKYSELLRIDFPRIPFTADNELFYALAQLGSRLASLHLLKSPELDSPAARFEGEGNGHVARSKRQGFLYDENKERLYINKTQYFAPLPTEIWEYQIGGYQVCDRWLRERRGRQLNHEDIRNYCRIVTALKQTIEIQEEIDEIYPAVEADTASW